MSDELRPAPGGHRPDQRRNRGAPAWWAELDRADLPEDSGPEEPRGAPEARRSPRRPAPLSAAAGRAGRLRNAMITGLVVFVAALAAWIGIGGGSVRSVVVVLLVFGVPALLAVVTATVVIRRSG
ncbi:MAG TPA: hypothetical protein VH134_06730 [Candidatus Dormibacteraeota bacterium]|jgi:hypothetical protein|nr:hypothetical protein [Candidatus Dormibacteraeota bacterium]